LWVGVRKWGDTEGLDFESRGVQDVQHRRTLLCNYFKYQAMLSGGRSERERRGGRLSEAVARDGYALTCVVGGGVGLSSLKQVDREGRDGEQRVPGDSEKDSP